MDQRQAVTTEHTGAIGRRGMLAAGAGLAGALGAAGFAGRTAPASAQAQAAQRATISLETALAILAGAEAKAREINVPMYIVILDESGVIKAAHRMDGNGMASTELAPRKAFTALAFRNATHTLAEANASDPARVVSIGANPRFTLLGGGVPIRIGGQVVGGIGVGGGSAQQDLEVALAGLAAAGLS
jgi:glc operon protein GlcG